VYKLAISNTSRAAVVGLLAVTSIACVVLIVLALRNADPARVPFIGLLCAATIWNWHVLLGIPYEIRFEARDRISFVALRGTTTIPAAALWSIKPYRGGGGFYVIRYEGGGKIRLLAQFSGFHEVITRLKAENPRLEVVGI
jgi:hypothetical protein